jgi:hypothetical protein
LQSKSAGNTAFFLKESNMKKFLLTLSTLMIGISSFAQTEKLKSEKYLDSLYFAEMMSRREIDEFEGTIKIDCPTLGTPASTIHLIKIINKGKSVYYMRLMTYGSTAVVDGLGVIVLFTDGTKLTKPNVEIDVDVDDNGFQYTAFFPVTTTDLKTLASKTINKFRLYIFDGSVREKDAADFKVYSKQIVLTK